MINIYFWIILFAVIGFYVFDLVVNWLNLKSLKKELPLEFREIYDEAEYKKLQDYTAVNTQFEFITSTFSLLVLLIFWLVGGFGFLDTLVRSWNQGPIVSGLLFIGILWVGNTILSLPFDIYHTFKIEQRFGFNRTTVATFVTDQIKSLVLGGILGGGLLALVLALFTYGGPQAWLYTWGAITVIMIALIFLAPAVILPLFNKFTPLEDGELKEAILNYGKSTHFPISGLFVMDGSKRSTKSNAFFTGFGGTKKIVLYDTLIKSLSVQEIVAVLAHEIGHYKHKHILQQIVLTCLNLGVFFFLASLFMQSAGLHTAFRVENVSIYCGLTFFMIFYTPLSRLLSVISGFRSRKHEFEADRFAAKTTGNPNAMMNALRQLSKTNLANLAPHPLYVVLYHSHPPILKRLEAIQSLHL